VCVSECVLLCVREVSVSVHVYLRVCVCVSECVCVSVSVMFYLVSFFVSVSLTGKCV